MHRLLIMIFAILAFAASLTHAGWTPEVRISEPGGCLYPQILAQGDTLHVVYTNGYGGDKISYVRSTDRGNSWSEYVVLSDTGSSYYTNFPGIIKYAQKIIVLWSNIIEDGIRSRNIGYSISNDCGSTWVGPSYILNPNWEHILYFSAAGFGTTINVILNSHDNQNLRCFIVRSTDFGISWSGTTELFQGMENGSMDMTSFGNYFYFVWSGNFNEYDTWETYYMRSTNAGVTWSDNMPLTELDGEASFWPSIDVDDSGHLAFCWTDYKNSPNWFTGDVFIRQSSDNGIYWTTERQISFTHYSLWTDVCKHGDSIFTTWDDERYGAVGRTIYFVQSLDNGATWTDEFRIEYDTSASSTPALTASDDYIYLIWADGRCAPDTDICGGIYFTRYEDETKVANGSVMPENIAILNSYPNPFNSYTIIAYKNLKGGEIDIYNINGQKVRTFKIAENKEGRIEWDARNALGNKVTSGIYFARARAGGYSKTIKLFYLK